MAKPKRMASTSHLNQGKRNIVPLVLALAGLVILLIAAFFVFQKKPTSIPAEVTGGPSIKTDQENVDLGYVKLGTPVKVSFTLTNVGDQPLKFSKAPYVEIKEGC